MCTSTDLTIEFHISGLKLLDCVTSFLIVIRQNIQNAMEVENRSVEGFVVIISIIFDGRGGFIK